MREKFIRVAKISKSNVLHIPVEALRQMGLEPYAGGHVEVWIRDKEVVLKPFRPTIKA